MKGYRLSWVGVAAGAGGINPEVREQREMNASVHFAFSSHVFIDFILGGRSHVASNRLAKDDLEFLSSASTSQVLRF